MPALSRKQSKHTLGAVGDAAYTSEDARCRLAGGAASHGLDQSEPATGSNRAALELKNEKRDESTESARNNKSNEGDASLFPDNAPTDLGEAAIA
jgi:hypothetical protein